MITLLDPTPEATRHLLVDIVYERVAGHLAEARPGHCLRVSALPEPVMRAVCERFHATDGVPAANGDEPAANVVLLLGPRQTPAHPYEVTATRLIELRNDGGRPLLAFVPPGLKAAAEDSFDVSTFVEIDLADAAKQLRRRLCEQLPEALRSVIRAVVQFPNIGADDDAVVRYYHTILANGASPAAVGGAIYQFGLIPHFKLADQPNRVSAELTRNHAAVEALRDSPLPLLGRVHQLRLQHDTLQPGLHNLLRRHGARGPRYWAGLIASDPAWANLAFDNWTFDDEVNQMRVLIWFDDLSLPRRQPDQPPGHDNPPMLDIGKVKDVRLSWRLEVKPAAVPGLDHYRLELVDADHTAIWESRNIPAGKTQSVGKSKKIKVADFRDQVADEASEGIYYFRVRAYSETDEMLNEEDPGQNKRILRDRDNPNSKRIYESQDFWLWIGQDDDPEVEPLRNVAVASFEEARLLTHLALIDKGEDPGRADPQPRKIGWDTKTTSRRAEAVYHIVYDAQTSYTLAVNNVLRRLERTTLDAPEQLGRLSLDCRDPVTTPDRAEVVYRPTPTDATPDAFLMARATLFAAIADNEAGGLGLVATADLPLMEDLIVAYASAFEAWLDDPAAETSGLWLDLDVTQVQLPGGVSVRLVGPTHPLRLLWQLQRARLGRAWLAAALAEGDPRVRLDEAARLFLRRGLAPVNLPLVVLDADTPDFAGAFVEQGTLNAFWGLYVPQTTRDKQTLRAQTQRVLGLDYRATPQADEIDPSLLAQKLGHYLARHPYLRTLKINAFNPGNAALIVEAMLAIEKERGASGTPLRYELRLFSQSDTPDDVGEAVTDLMNPDRQVRAEADAFTVAGRNHLFPKLRLSRHRLDDFLDAPERFEAHVTLLRDVFPVAAQPVAEAPGRSSYLHGLIQEQVSAFNSDGQHFNWQRRLAPCPTPELGGGPPVAARLGSLLKQFGRRQVEAAESAQPGLTAGLALNLPIQGKSILYEVHAVSDWVFIIDRYLGLEYFDSAATPGRPLYLLDFAPSAANPDADRLLLTTRVVDEVARLVRPALATHDLVAADHDLTAEVEVFFLQLLRSLSGRLALKLIAAPNQGKEALSLALARLFLEQYGLLSAAVIIPLDAHTNLFTNQRDVDGGRATATRGDLLLITGSPAARRLDCHIIEVKWRADLSGFGESHALRQDVARQLTETEQALRRHFDPGFAPVDRVDRQVKTKELMTLLSFYLDRARRYGLVGETAAAELHDFFQSLDAGYGLFFSGSGLFFDRAFNGLTSEAEPSGRAYHRIGRDFARRLLDNALAARPAPDVLAPAPDEPRREPTMRDDATYRTVRALFPRSATGEARDQEPTGGANSPGRPGTDTAAGRRPSPPDGAPVPPPPRQPSTPTPNSSAVARPSAGEPPTPLPQTDILLGLDSMKLEQYGLLGTAAGKRLALDLNGTNTISLFGVQGGGKSYSVGTVVEMATRPLPGLNHLPSPLATVIFHYHESQDYAPEFVSMIRPNSVEGEVAALREQYGAEPAALEDVLLLTSPDMVAARRREFPGVRVAPILFGSTELGSKEWRFLMGVSGNQMYMKQMTMIMRRLRREDGAMALDALRTEIEASALNDMQKTILDVRLNLAEQFIDDAVRLGDTIRPGRLIIVDLRDETIEKDEALGLFVVMLNIFAGAGRNEGYNKLIVFDEAHKYMDNRDLTSHIVDAIRQMRHQGVSLLIASQDPPSLPNEIIELSSLVILHRFNSPQWLKHVQRSVTALSELTPAEMAGLRPGEAFIWAAKATEPLFTRKVVRARLRPRATEHGGGTRTAL